MTSTRRVLVPLNVAPIIPVPAPRGEKVSLGGETMGTTWSVKLVPPAHVSPRSLHAGIQAALDGVIAQMSTWIVHSDISRFNRAAADTWCALPDDLVKVLRYALTIAEGTGGAYDPTIGALVDLWGFGPHGRPGMIPSDGAIASARARCGWQCVQLDSSLRALQPGGVHLDLSSIAKGFAVDKVSAYLERCGVPNHLVEIGGELRGHGIKQDGDPWWVALEEPRAATRDCGRAMPETIVALHGLAIATSGDTQRYFEREGCRLSHTIDPRSGRPVPERLASVTVLHRSCMGADALATALLVLGPEQGFATAVRLNLAARFVLRHVAGFEEQMTPAMAAMLD